MNISKKVLLLSLTLALLLHTSCVLAVNQAELQLSVPFPDPVKAGEKITFQIVILNVGSETWVANQYSAYAEIYDSEEKYLTKTEPVTGNVTVGPSGMVILYLPFQVPPDEYDGIHKYRILLNCENKRILYSDYLSFSVSSAVHREGAVVPVSIKGRSMLSYRNGTDGNWKNYLWNFNTGLVGQAFENPFIFKLDSNYTEEGIKLNTVLFNCRISTLNISFGDVMPVFSSLSLTNMGMRGLLLESKPGKMEISGVAASSASAQQGMDTSPGVFARYVYGARVGIAPLKEMKFGVSCVYTNDDRGSLINPGPTLTPVRNLVLCSDVSCLFLKNFLLDGEYAYSFYSPDVLADPAGTTGDACRISLSAMFGDITAGITYKNIGPNFNSVNSPSSVPDRAGVEGLLNYGFDFMKIFLLYGRFNDNLSQDISRVRTAIDNLSTVITLSFPGYPVFTLGYVWNSLSGNPPNLVNNFTRNASAGISHKIRETSISLGYQLSEFFDLTSLSSALLGRSVNLRIVSMLGNRISTNLGINYSHREEVDTLKIEESTAASIGASYKFIPEKFVCSGLASISHRTDNAGSADNLYSNLNIDGTYNFTKESAFTTWVEWINNVDSKNAAGSYNTWRLGTRFSYSF